jgi:hypothetical protein
MYRGDSNLSFSGVRISDFGVVEEEKRERDSGSVC